MTPAQFKRLAALDSLLPQSFELDSRAAQDIEAEIERSKRMNKGRKEKHER